MNLTKKGQLWTPHVKVQKVRFWPRNKKSHPSDFFSLFFFSKTINLAIICVVSRFSSSFIRKFCLLFPVRKQAAAARSFSPWEAKNFKRFYSLTASLFKESLVSACSTVLARVSPVTELRLSTVLMRSFLSLNGSTDEEEDSLLFLLAHDRLELKRTDRRIEKV